LAKSEPEGSPQHDIPLFITSSFVIKFICDDNLGKLAKWLRALGYDTLFFDPIEDGEMVKRALSEDRVILSRDRELSRFKLKPGERILLIQSEKPLDQLSQVVKHFKLKTSKEQIFSRCLICNHILEKADKEKIKDRLYPYVYQTQDDFKRCPQCDRIYWPATHVERMIKVLSDSGII
jgi:uncharacterized protein with PIN domain